MRSLDNANPFAAFCYFCAVIGICMFCRDPIISTVSLVFSVSFYFIRGGRGGALGHILTVLFFIVLTVINPFFYHNGATVLFVFGNSPVTLEALFYGACSAETVVAVIYWFRSFSEIMTEDKLLSVFGSLSPKLSLMLSMVLRFIPMFTRRIKQVNDAQKVLGLYKNDNIVDSVRGGARVFSGVSGWALEGGITTADSMEARGYGVKRRTSFSLYRMHRADVAFFIVTAAFFGAATAGLIISDNFVFYPEMSAPSGTWAVLAYSFYGVLCALSVIYQLAEEAKWKLSLSKI